MLTRDANRARSKLPYANVQVAGPQEWESAISGCSGVVNLAGEPISTRCAMRPMITSRKDRCRHTPGSGVAKIISGGIRRIKLCVCRWGPRVKEEIYDSRIKTTKRIVCAINNLPADQRPAVLVSTSAVGYYGVSTSDTFDEASRPGSDYLAKVCQDWESEASKADARVVILRSGIILAKNGGALGKMVPVFMMFGGAICLSAHACCKLKRVCGPGHVLCVALTMTRCGRLSPYR